MKQAFLARQSSNCIWNLIFLSLCFCFNNNTLADSSSPMVTPKTAAEIYARRCSVCHGDDGSGARWAGASLKPPPRNFTDPTIRDALTRSHMIASVINGRPGTAMPAFGSRIDHQTLAEVVDYIRFKFMRISANSGNHDLTNNALLEHDSNRVNPDAGGTFYNENCATCHGQNGDGNGPRAYFIFPKPVNFQEHAKLGHLTREELFSSIKFGVRGREMPAWGTVLNDQDILNVAEFVYLSFVKPEHGDESQ